MKLNIKPKRLPSGAWHTQIQIEGRRYSITRDTKQECIDAAVILQVKAAEASDDIKKIAYDKVTLRGCLNDYINRRTNVLSPSTLRGYDSIVRNRFKDYMDLPLSKITDWQTMVNDEAEQVSAKTVHNAWGLVYPAINEYGICPKKVLLPQIVEKDSDIIEFDKMQMFLDSIKGDENELAILLALHGLRRSEIFAVDKKDIVDGIIRVRGSVVIGRDGKFVEKETNKNSPSRRDVPILIDRVKVLVRQAPDGKLCPADNHAAYDAVKEHCEKCGLPHVSLHGLRHSFASLCYHLRLSEKETMKLGGWKDHNTMKKIYTHLEKKDETDAALKLKDFFKDIKRMG